VSGTSPERIITEVRKNKNQIALTYWYYWSHDRVAGDHADWEPVSLLYVDGKLVEIFSRAHDALVRFLPTGGVKPLIYFIAYGHTPAIRVDNIETDIQLFRMNDRKDSIRKSWLDLCYQRANSNDWMAIKTAQLPELETINGAVLDSSTWKVWGKHSVYLRI